MKKLALTIFCLSLAGCGGGGGSSGGGGNVDPTGIWLGTFTESGGDATTVIGFIIQSQIHLISNGEDSNESGLVYQGLAGVSGRNINAVTENRMADAGTGSPVVSSYDISAELVTLGGIRNIRGNYTSSDGTRGVMVLTYDSITELGSSLETIADTWGVNTGGSSGFSLTIDENGVLFGNVSGGCVYNGQVSVIDPAVNIYGVELLIESCTEESNNGNHTGYAFIDNRGANRQLFLSAVKINEPT
jgi:hypothetical protein